MLDSVKTEGSYKYLTTGFKAENLRHDSELSTIKMHVMSCFLENYRHTVNWIPGLCVYFTGTTY